MRSYTHHTYIYILVQKVCVPNDVVETYAIAILY